MDGNATKSKRDERRDRIRDRILEIAAEVFYEQGFAGASMSEIASRLGGSKGTLYNYFESKDELFEAFIRERCSVYWEEAFRFAYDEHRGVRELLEGVGEAAIRMLDERIIGLIRILIGESPRVPELIKIFFAIGPDAKAKRLAAYLEEAKARGEIDPADCYLAAHQFMALFRGGFYFRTLFNLTSPEDLPAARQEIAAAIDMFMAAYGREPGSAARPKAKALQGA